MATKAQKKVGSKYNKTHTIGFYIRLNKGTDADVIEKLKTAENRQGYIKDLIRQDIKSSK